MKKFISILVEEFKTSFVVKLFCCLFLSMGLFSILYYIDIENNWYF